MTQTLLHVALGGALGASARHLANIAALRTFGAGFPWGTLAVNVVGSFLMGLMFVMLAQKGMVRLSPFLMTGILGGFTTFSAFSLDAFVLWERGQTGAATLYVAGSVLLSLATLVGGMALARAVLA